MICLHCEEPILPAETFAEVNGGRDQLHIECEIRVIVGSAAHQLHECTCYGGTREDPPGVTAREAARLARDVFELARRMEA